MAIAYLLPSANGNYNDFSLGLACSEAWQCIDDPPSQPNNGTTFLSETTNASRQSVLVSNANINISINGLTVTARVIKFGIGTAATFRIFLRVNGVNYDGSTLHSAAVGIPYTNYTESWLINPATNQAWQQADLPSLEIGVLLVAIGSSGISPLRLSQLYITMDFTPGPVYRLDGQDFTCGPISKRWLHRQIAQRGTSETIFAAFWQLELTFGDRPKSDALFFEKPWLAGGLHTIRVPHPETGVMTGFTGVAIRDVSYGYTDIERNAWVDSLQVTFGRIWLGATGSV